MTDAADAGLEREVRRLLFEERLSNVEAAARLGVEPSEVLATASRLNGKRRVEPCETPRPPLDEPEQVARLRRQVRAGLIERTRPDKISSVPASALVRLWQLVEDPGLLGPRETSIEEIFDIPEETMEAISRLLDERHEASGVK